MLHRSLTPPLRRPYVVGPAVLFVALSAALVPGLSGSSRLAAQVVGEKKDKKIKIEWDEFESKNYQIRFESVIPKSTIEHVAEELEDILAEYVKLFREKPPKEKFRVKFLDSDNTYEQEGGDPSHPGYYNPGSKFLVLKQLPFRDLVPTAYHEAFHQYLHFYVGDDVAIPTWFNEGMAMYFERMQRLPGAGKRPLNPKDIQYRNLRMVKDAVFARSVTPLAELVDADYATFHDKDKESLHYNQSFAVIYFLMKSMRGAPMAYAKSLKETKEVESANEKMFGKERKNLEKVEKAWKQYLAKLEIPDK